MKKTTITLLSIIYIFIFTQNSYSQEVNVPRGKVVENLSIKSNILNEEVKYSVYLPYDYDVSERSYPVVYLLHGYSDDEPGWIQFGEVHMAADKAIANREIPPMIIIMPDGRNSYYINSLKYRFEDMFFKEFIPHIENKYRIRKKKEYRGIAGLSMGGFGTTLYALKHPDMFCAFAAFSSAYRTNEDMIKASEEKYKRSFAPLFGEGLSDEERITDMWLENNIFEIVKNTPPEKLKSVKMYIDCGDDDFLYNGNSRLHILLRDLKIPHEYRVRNGGHSWKYWRTGITTGLKFIGNNFHR